MGQPQHASWTHVDAYVARRGSEGGRASETACRGGQAAAESQRRIVQDAAERLEEVS